MHHANAREATQVALPDQIGSQNSTNVGEGRTMRPAGRTTVMAACLASVLAAAATAQDSPQARVARLIPLLGSHSYAERRLATDELERLGPLAREQLQKEAEAT